MRTPAFRGETLLDWALRYASLGWPVLPLGAQSKAPLTTNGLLNADTRPEVLRAWWSLRPNANIGLRTGEAFDVIDVDGDEGRSSLSERAGPEWGDEHSGPVSLTGKGQHYLILPTRSRNRAGLLPNVDYRGVNGYIVAPPSIHPDGRVYQWDPTRDESTKIPTAPEWIKDLLVPYEEKVRINRVNFDSAKDVRDFFAAQGIHMKQSADRYVIRCPLPGHRDSEPSFNIYPPYDNWYCYGCDTGGDLRWLRKLLK